jgi:hypothetical protein
LIALDLPGGTVLLQADNGLFAARTENGGVSVERVGNAEMGRVSAKRDVPGGEGVLISAGKWNKAPARR